MADTPLIEVRDLHQTYMRPRGSLFRRRPRINALQGVSFDISGGQRFGIVGESGSGKSTLLRLLCGLQPPTSGSIRFAGRQIAGRSEHGLRLLRAQVQLVFQDPMSALDPRMRVRNIITEPMLKGRQPDPHRRVREVLAAVGLPSDAADRFPHQFSAGQRQRISIARALVTRPAVLLADEPVSALDVSVRAQILNLLADLVEQYSLTLVFVSHDLLVVRHVCDTIAVLHDGRLVELGSTEQVHEAPQHPYTRQLLAAVPTIRRTLGGIRAAQPPHGAPSIGVAPAHRVEDTSR